MTQPLDTPPFERRWPVMLAIFVVLALVTVLPRHLKLVPAWVLYACAALLLVPMAMVGTQRGEKQRYWLRVEHAAAATFAAIAVVVVFSALVQVIRSLLQGSPAATGVELLAGSVALWAGNVLAFSLVYWLVDRGGPEARAGHREAGPDWTFPPESAPGPAGSRWTPTYVDYLFLAFTTATAFSPTDTLPLTSRAKLLVMLQTILSLATILVVASRAVNVLGS
jgi:uncharacterized membrane protein